MFNFIIVIALMQLIISSTEASKLSKFLKTKKNQSKGSKGIKIAENQAGYVVIHSYCTDSNNCKY
jgi:hypothetical protein